MVDGVVAVKLKCFLRIHQILRPSTKNAFVLYYTFIHILHILHIICYMAHTNVTKSQVCEYIFGLCSRLISPMN